MFGIGSRKVLKYSAIDTSLALDVEDTVTCFCSTREKFSGISDNHLESSSSSSVSASGTHTPIMMRSPARGAVALTETTTSSASAPVTPVHNSSSSSSSATGGTNVSSRLSLFDTCHRKIRLFGELVAKARRKEKDAGATEDPKLYLEEAALERQLPELDLRMLVDLPAGLDYNEWLASHTLALFDHINLFYGTISEFCTMTGCPDMTGPGLRTYLWFDEKGKKTRVAAPQYIDYVMTFTQRTVSDETIFPTKYANEFPSSFESIVRKILRLLYHVVAHIYHCHFREVALLGLHAHLNCVFAHLTLLNQRFNLIDPKETEILGDLEAALLGDSTPASSQPPAIQETPTTTT
ncbi:MOB kinase activator-like 2 isoform X1 [Neodiprion pinetum]|uniref:MOB kinase activator-like 2 isoform X1 n=1 Tax=Neodiprion pinetum TaxID=441929 RepID=UPI001EDF5575|nr:MOB kinase activator-like 2 isoform X1 [Neodiprion pinetum]